MLTIARTYLRSAAEAGPDEEIESLGRRAYESVVLTTHEFEEVHNLGFTIDVREGSLSIIAVVLAAAWALYEAITRYDSFWSGVERIREHADAVARTVRHRFKADPIVARGGVLSTRVSTGHLDKLHRLHDSVAIGRITPEQAVQEVLRTLGAAGESVDDTVISQVEAAFGVQPIGRARLEQLREEHRARGEPRVRVPGGLGPVRIEPVLPPPRRRRMLISQRPGSETPTVKFKR